MNILFYFIGYWIETHDRNVASLENLEDLTFFSLHKIIKATDNFHIDKKIGEGGFGSVYKVIL